MDLLLARPGTEPEIADAAEFTEIAPGLGLPDALAGHLAAVELLARDDATRPKDLPISPAVIGRQSANSTWRTSA